jgi:long-chain acyl-CoA synthetase
MHRPKIFIVPAPGVEPNKETKEAILKYASKRIAKYAMPKDLEFRTELPKTMVGKVAYRVLEEEEAAKLKESETGAQQPEKIKKH